MNLEWIDSHTHLEHEYPFSVDEYIRNAKEKGVTRFITIGTEPATLTKLKETAEKYAEVFFTSGIHPHEAKDYTPEVEAIVQSLLIHPKCKAVGEIGLDYYYEHSSTEEQLSALRLQLALALKNKKPVVIHARDAEADLKKELKIFADRSEEKGVIHCFSGTEDFARACLDMGFYISFSGILTFKTAQDLREIARFVPLDRLLLETDSPFLAPIPFRGKPNQSAYLVETAKVLSDCKKISMQELSQQTVENTCKLFDL